MNMQNVHNAQDVHTHRKPKNTKHWRLSWFRYETFITFFKFRFFNTRRETIFLCWLFVHRQLSTHWPDQRACAPHRPQTGLASPTSEKIYMLRLSPNLNSLLLFKIVKNPSPSLPGMTSFTSPVLFPIWVFDCEICDCHILPARAWTPALMSAPTHELSLKVLSLTKPKDKIYKTKNDNIRKNSFRNYIILKY